jgi:hypothetical protein
LFLLLGRAVPALDIFGPNSPYSEPRDGHLFLGETLRWIATQGGCLESDEAAAHWEDAEQELFTRLGTGALVAEGANKQGEYVPIRAGLWPLASSDYEPDRPTVVYPDRIGGTFGGTLQVGSERWEGVRVRKIDVERFWPFRPRDTLITWVQRGRLTPEQAAAEATRLGLEPLLSRPNPADFDATTEPYWTIGMVLTWIMTLETDCVREAWEKWREATEFWSCKKWQVPGGPIYEGCFIERVGPFGVMDLHVLEMTWSDTGQLKTGWRAAWEQFSAPLKRNDLQAYGVPESGGERIVVSSFHWQDLALYENRRGRLAVRVRPGLDPGYEDVVLATNAVLALWPDTTQTKGRRGRKAGYNWPAFTAEAIRQLDEEGDIDPEVDVTWTQAELERRMLAWCGNEWGRSPAESMVRKHVIAAVRKFRESPRGR